MSKKERVSNLLLRLNHRKRIGSSLWHQSEVRGFLGFKSQLAARRDKVKMRVGLVVTEYDDIKNCRSPDASTTVRIDPARKHGLELGGHMEDNSRSVPVLSLSHPSSLSLSPVLSLSLSLSSCHVVSFCPANAGDSAFIHCFVLLDGCLNSCSE